jgi:membrane protein implicated in regulation of membrane protease activity
MLYETPQFIRQEVKLMGIITFNQLWLMVGVLGFLAILFFTLNNMVLWFIIFIILAPSSLYVTFGQMNGQPMYKVFPSAIRHLWLPKYYFWKKQQTSISESNRADLEHKQTIIKPSVHKELDEQTLNNLSQFLDQ